LAQKQVHPIEGASAPAKEQLTFRQVIVTRSGPLPDPQTLREYSQLVPDAVERIFSMAERDQQFIQTYQLREQAGRHRHLLAGQIFGFILGISAIAAAVALALNDKSLTGATIFLGGVVTLIGTAIWAQKVSKVDAPKSE
jgi:uncharacterized membrane protein